MTITSSLFGFKPSNDFHTLMLIQWSFRDFRAESRPKEVEKTRYSMYTDRLRKSSFSDQDQIDSRRVPSVKRTTVILRIKDEEK